MTCICVPQQFKTISEAVQNANPGDTIKVAFGVYNESVLVDVENLKIEGCKCRKPIVTGLCIDGCAGFELTEKAICISNFCIKEGFTFGVLVSNSYCKVSNCTICKCQESGIEISESVAESKNCEPVTDTLIQCVTCEENGCDGLSCNGNCTSVLDSTFNNNCCDGINITSINNLILRCKTNFNCKNGIDIDSYRKQQCALNNIIDCKICNNCGDGIKSNLDTNIVVNCCIKCNCGDGIDISNTCGSTIVTNKIECNKGTGVKICNGDNNKVTSNKIICNKKDGISIESGRSNSIDDNCISNNNKAGLFLGLCSCENVVRDNCFECNDPNIFAADPDKNFFCGNVKINNCCC